VLEGLPGVGIVNQGWRLEELAGRRVDGPPQERGEIAVAERVVRPEDLLDSLDPLAPRLPVEGPECLVLALIETRDHDRTGEHQAELVAPQRVLLLPRLARSELEV